MKKISRLMALLLALLLLLTSLAACGVNKRPLNYLKSSFTRTLARSTAGEILSLAAEALTAGSASFAFTGNGNAPVSAGSAALYFNRENGRLMADTALTVAGERYDAGLWVSESELAFTSTAFLGSTTLGVNLGTLEQDLKNSIFRSNSGIAFANPRVDDHTDDAVRALVNGLFTLYRAGEALKPLLDKHLEGFLKNLTKYANYSRYTERGRVYIYLEVDNSMLSRALRDAWAEAAEDKALVAHLRELAGTRDAMASALEGVTVDDYAAKVEHWLASDAEIEALCAKIDNAAPFRVELSATVRRLTAGVMQVALTYTAGEDVRGFSLDLTEKDTAVLTLTTKEAAHKLVWNTEKDGMRNYRATFEYARTGEDATAFNGIFDVNCRKNTYTLTTEGAEARTVTGSIQLNRKGFSFTVDTVTAGARRVEFTCAFAVKAKDTRPEMPPYVSLVTITEPRFTPVYHRASEAYTRLSAALAESGISPNAEGIFAYIFSQAEIKV